MFSRYLFSLLFLFFTLGAASQSRPRQIDRAIMSAEPLDTTSLPNTKAEIEILANGTWRYTSDRSQSLEIFQTISENWTTNTLFTYKDVKLQDLDDEIDIEIAPDLDNVSLPIRAGRVTSRYGMRGSRHHNGYDIGAPTGTPLYATFDGKVRCAMYHSGGYGNIVIIRGINGLESWYGHMSRIEVSINDYVRSGQIIGYVGNTGRSTGPHLHFELRYKDQVFDPSFVFDFDNRNLRYTRTTLLKSNFNIHSRASEVLDEEDASFVHSGELFAAATDDATLNKAAGIDKNGNYTPTSTRAVYHSVRSGESLGRIASRYGTTIDAICRLNRIKRTSVIRIGQRLRVR